MKNTNDTHSASDSFSAAEQIWDEITKSITEKMPHQLLPLIEEVFHRTYPPNASVTLLATEHIVPPKTASHHMEKIMTDITILVDGRDLYHIECQITNDREMVIRMVEYDFHIALLHSRTITSDGMYTLRFPNSVVMYPGTNASIPDVLKCRVIFPDGSEHIYTVPTVKIQSYSLEDIQKKHLTLFIPFKLISFRPRLSSKQSPIQTKELTDYVNQLIVILEQEVQLGNLSPTEYCDYVKLINYSAERIFHSFTHLQEEVFLVTKSKLKLPSDEIEELKAALAEKDSALAEKDSVLAEKDSVLAEKDSEIQRYEKLLLEHGIPLN